jgi:hypothetical protein
MAHGEGLWQLLLQRIEALLGGFLGSRIQRSLLRKSINDAADIERQARRLESENMPDLAAMLRQQAARIDPDDPCQAGSTVLENLDDGGHCSPRRMLSYDAGTDKSEQQPPKPSRRKAARRTRRSEPED